MDEARPQRRERPPLPPESDPIAVVEWAGWKNPTHVGDIIMRFQLHDTIPPRGNMMELLAIEGIGVGYAVLADYDGGSVYVVRKGFGSGGIPSAAFKQVTSAMAQIVIVSDPLPLDDQQDIIRKVFEAVMASVDREAN